MNNNGKYVDVKSVFESLFGYQAWAELKESNSVSTWKKWTEKLFSAIALSVDETVTHFDKEWRSEITSVLKEGRACLKLTSEIDEVISVMASVFIRLSFWQIGFMPNRKLMQRKIRLTRSDWNLGSERTVIYYQSAEQKHAQALRKLKKKIGVTEALGLEAKYRRSKSCLRFDEWLDTKDAIPVADER